MKKTNIFLTIIFLFLMISQYGLIYYSIFNSNNFIMNSHALSSVEESQIINMNYEIGYEIKSKGSTTKDSIPIMLSINGTNKLYENGTISYYIEKNITDSKVLSLMSNIFFEKQLDFFQNHQINESFQTYFSYRRETMINNASQFLTNSSYTIFWLNTSGNRAGYIKQYRNIKFLNVNSPFRMGINDENRVIAEKTWSEKRSELSKNVRILNSFYLKANFNSEEIINLYFDKTWTILLRGTIEIYDSPDNSYVLEIKLIDSNLELEFLPNNPYWETRLRNLLIFIPLSSAICLIVVFLYLKKFRIKKKDDILDKI